MAPSASVHRWVPPCCNWAGSSWVTPRNICYTSVEYISLFPSFLSLPACGSLPVLPKAENRHKYTKLEVEMLNLPQHLKIDGGNLILHHFIMWWAEGKPLQRKHQKCGFVRRMLLHICSSVGGGQDHQDPNNLI